MERKALQRILTELGGNDLLETLSDRISLSDLNTLLLQLYGNITKNYTYSQIMEKYSLNRFVKPADIDPIALKQLELDIFKIAGSLSYQSVLLSPVTVLGSCSVVAPVSQNHILSATRGTEVVADATNALALHICHLIKTGQADHKRDPIRLCTTHRHVRAQKLKGPGSLSHFHVFCMVTSGRDKGAYTFEKQALAEHLNLYQTVFRHLFDTNFTVRLSKMEGYKDTEGCFQSLCRHVKENVLHAEVIETGGGKSNSYYKGLRFKMFVRLDGKEFEAGDGGFTDWPQKLLSDKKERMMISAIGLDRLLHNVRTTLSSPRSVYMHGAAP